ncbi:hypothetical protein MGMO_53c00340 [Methyloglobulus morosus KoM1]|uniref:Immunity protein 35 domain-containing protein n=1 Tax=Methyloglobulus morosus KoM1 TaxID=1116472 RepID=V5BH05_9GAMM|nr:hypothetical protein [Methyloglobulus morosus]ESS72575.1 hypothetical protein MGMO_53c00340 [Methyloglobulus morosus KoM1]
MQVTKYLTSEVAKLTAQKWINDTCRAGNDLLPNIMFEDDDYLVFNLVSRRYLETKDDMYIIIGNNPNILDKRDGRVFGTWYSYAQPFQERINEILKNQRAEIKRELEVRQFFPGYDMQKSYKIFIKEIYNFEGLLNLLDSLKLSYTIPEIESGNIWRIPKAYDKKLLHKRLTEPTPITFCSFYFENFHELVTVNSDSKLCEIDIEEFQSKNQRKAHDPSKAKPEDLEPVW